MQKVFYIILIACNLIISFQSCGAISELEITDEIYKICNNDTLKLDILQPVNKKHLKNPVMVYIHGGGFTKGNKESIYSSFQLQLLNKLRNNGYTLISINYRLANGTVTLPLQIADCKDAIRWIRKNADKYNLDSSKIGVWGTSAGAYLALMVAYTKDNQFIGDQSLYHFSAKVNLVIENFGPSNIQERYQLYDFTDFEKLKYTAPKQYEKAVHQKKILFAEKSFDGFKSAAVKFSPVNYITNESPPTLILHGKADIIVPIEQAILLKDSLENHAVKYRIQTYDNIGHGFKNASDEKLKEIVNTMYLFIKKYLDYF